MLDSLLRLAINEIQLQISVQQIVVSHGLHSAQRRILLRYSERHFRQHFGLDELSCDRRVTLKKHHHTLVGAVIHRIRIDIFHVDEGFQ
jgi:nucleotidyltransferase/DNA polymerase involved in DNA repair